MGGGKGGGSQVTGYRYFLGMHLILCYGPIDEILRMDIGDRRMWTSSNVGGDRTPVTSSAIALVSGKSELFGGKEKEGGVGYSKGVWKSRSKGGGFFNRFTGNYTAPSAAFGQGGDIYCDLGEGSQVENPYLDAKISPGNVPAYRGVSALTFAGFYVGDTPQVKEMQFQVARYPSVIAGEDSRKQIGNDANAAQIIYECLTNVDWGMGYNDADMDVVSFQAASLTMHTEGLGISMVWGESQPIEDFLTEVLKHINASLYLALDTGLFVLKMVRDDYTPAALPLYDDSNIIDMKSFSRKTWGETVNELTVVYTKSGTGKSIPVTVQDLANIQIQGTTINQKSEYPGITSEANALLVAQRDLTTVSHPLARVEFTINREAWDVATGDVFRLSWPKYGILEVVFRVGAVNYGSLKDSKINISAIEDVFGLPTATYGKPQASGWIEPVFPPQAATNRLIQETNYWNIVQAFGEAAAENFLLATPLDGYYYVTAVKPTSDHYFFAIGDRANGSGSDFDEAGASSNPFAPSCLLEFAMETDFDTTFTYTGDQDMSEVPIGELCTIDDEFMQVYSLDQLIKEVKVYRGMLDTLPKNHVLGSRVYFNQTSNAISGDQYTDGDVIDVKILTKSGQGTLDETTAPFDTFTFQGRAGMPYPPGNLQVEGYPAFQAQGMTGSSPPLDYTWSHRDRTQQTSESFVYQDEGDVGPEPGTTYTIRLYNELLVLSRTVTGIAGTSYSWTTELADSGFGGLNSLIRVELEAIVGGLSSYQAHEYDFRRADYGYSYGMFYGGIV